MKNKIVLVYKDIEGRLAEETIWGQLVEENYKVDNIPFYAPNLALNDIISVEDDDGVLYFNELIKPSGHSTIQVIFFNQEEIKRVTKVVEQLGCQWEGMKNQPYFAVDVPFNVDYRPVRQFLIQELNNQILDFKEACLSENHS